MSTEVSLWSGDVSCLKLLSHQILLAENTMNALGIVPLQTVHVASKTIAKEKQLILLECVMAPSSATIENVACVHTWVMEILYISHGETVTISHVTYPRAATDKFLLTDDIHIRIIASYSLWANSNQSFAPTRKRLDNEASLLPLDAVSVREAYQRLLMVVLGTIEIDGRYHGVIQVGQLIPFQVFGQMYLTSIIGLRKSGQKLPIGLYNRNISSCPRIHFSTGDPLQDSNQHISYQKGFISNELDGDVLKKKLWKLGLCGIHHQLREILWCITLIVNPEVFVEESSRNWLESARFRGVIICGCAGSGKTELLNVIENEVFEHYRSSTSLDVDVIRWDATWLVLEYEDVLTNDTFFEFIRNKLMSSLSGKALEKCSALILLDNLDELFLQNENEAQSDVHSIGNGIISLFDHLDELNACRICVVVTCQDESMARLPSKIIHPSRLGKCFELAPPTESIRRDILAQILIKLPVCVEFDCDEIPDPNLFALLSSMQMNHEGHQNSIDAGTICALATRIASRTAGCVPRDLIRLCRHVLAQALSDSQPIQAIKWPHVMAAIATVKPSQLRHLDVNTPHIHRSNDLAFAGYEKTQTDLHQVVDASFRPSEAMKRLGVMASSGILLYGPSGCGKSLLAKVVAARANVNLISIKSSEIMSKYFGDSEEAIRRIFARARSASPSILFFDEFDAIACKRFGETHTKDSEERAFDGSNVYNRILSTFLNEMDGIGHAKRSGYHTQKSEKRKQVLVIAATNRVDALDKALIRPGRIDKKIFLDYPNLQDRKAILKLSTRRMPLKDDVDLDVLASRSYESPATGADLANICKEAALMALREDPNASHVENRHFQEAWEHQMSSSTKD